MLREELTLIKLDWKLHVYLINGIKVIIPMVVRRLNYKPEVP